MLKSPKTASHKDHWGCGFRRDYRAQRAGEDSVVVLEGQLTVTALGHPFSYLGVTDSL